MNENSNEKKYHFKLPKEHSTLKFSLFFEIISSLSLLISTFFSFGRIANEQLPSLWDFVTYSLKIDTQIPSYIEFLVPLKSIALIAFISGILFLIASLVKLYYFINADTNVKIYGYCTYVSGANSAIRIIELIFTIASLLVLNKIAVDSFIIESYYVYIVLTLYIVNFASLLVHQIYLARHYSVHCKQLTPMLSSKEKQNGFLPGVIIVLLSSGIIFPIILGLVNNVYLNGFDQTIHPNFPFNEHLTIYSCDFDELPRIITNENKIVLQEENHFYFYTNNYHYYQARINAIEEEILTSYDFAEIAEKANILQELQNNFSELVYGRVYVDFSIISKKHEIYNGYISSYRVNELTYDAMFGKDNPKKWNSDKEALNFAFEEKIELETDTFEKGTDFNSIKVGVKVFYNDGSMKIYYVTPSNATELSSASVGTHNFDWFDEWGDYSVKIVIK